MKNTISLGRVAGVRIGLHWSVVGIVVLIVAVLSAYQLPAVLPGQPVAGYVLGGISAAVLLVLSLLCHEVAHAIVARRNGVGVDGITLWLLGGVARLRGEAPTPGAELRITAVGPLTSGALAVVFGAATFGAAALDAYPLIIVVLAYLALLNVVLAVFNLLPAAPLDGGRVLRAVLWWWRGDRFTAAVWSARAGRGLGYLLVLAGLVQIAFRGLDGLWWVLLGWFIASMAAAEERQAHIGVALADVRVRDVMSSPVETVESDQTVERFLGDEAARRHSAFPLVDHGRLDGLLTLRRLGRVPREASSSTSLRSVATPLDRVPVAEPDEPLPLVLPRLDKPTEGRLLVRTGERLVGIVSPSDIHRTLARHGLPSPPIPGGKEQHREPREPPPSGWWYPGQSR